MRIAADGSVGINKSVPGRTLDVDGNFRVTHSENDGFNITANDTVGNSSYTAALLDYNVSVSDSLSLYRNHIGLYIDVDSSASGGNTSEEHRLFGSQVQVKATSDSDIIYGLYANAEAEISTGQVSSMYGLYGRAESDGVGGQISTTYGVLGAAVLNNDAGVTQTSAQGVFGKCTVSGSNAADVNNLIGGYFEIQLDNPAVDNVPVNYMYGTRIEIDLNDNSDGGSYDLSGTNSYLLYANYSVISGGSMPGNAYGLYINDTVENFFRGSLRVDDGAVFNEQGLAASDFRVESDTQTHMLYVDGDNNFVGFNASTATANSGASFQYYTGGVTLNVSHNSSAANGDKYIWFRRGGGPLGSIPQVSDTGVAYNTTSDARMKENIFDADDAGKLLEQIKVRQFDWRETGEHQRFGMIAQELAEVVPEVVSVPSNPDDMQGIDYSRLMPLVIKEIQDLRARVQQLTRS